MNKLLLYLVIFSLIIACGTPRRAGVDAKTNNYKHDVTAIHPQFTVFHINDSVSELHFKIASKELLYMRPDGINFSSNVLISYRLVPSYDSKEILDSSSVRLVDMNNDNSEKYLVGKMDVKAYSPRSYFLRITVLDLNRNMNATAVVAVEKDNDLNRQNFLVKSITDDVALFRNYFVPGEKLSISYKAKIGVNVYVRYYNRDFPLAAPPFSMTDPKPFQYKPDSTYSLQLSPSGNVNFTATKKGFYHIQLDTSKRDGITLFNFSETFPEIKKAEDMVPPLRFITSKEEFDALTSSTNKKATVEKFWLNCTGNQDRAKEVIRKYYNRVQDANKYFTSYLEGWKTDRGMTYLIYGTPNVIYRTANSETWIYGEENNINSLQYSFSRVNNPFTDNDFTLERSTVYKQSWYVAVDIWRQGRTFSLD
ncbi:MAG: GWxTD domain-containing protein [Bacteroidetes bacterium]|nr:GWxTD domain-containing protein [Bacteroidota bacterium]